MYDVDNGKNKNPSDLFGFIKHFHLLNLADFCRQIFHTRHTLSFFGLHEFLSSMANKDKIAV